MYTAVLNLACVLLSIIGRAAVGRDKNIKGFSDALEYNIFFYFVPRSATFPLIAFDLILLRTRSRSI